MFSIYDRETYAKVNSENKELLEAFRDEYKMLGKSKGTIDQYSFDIRGFFCYCYDNFKNKFILDLKKKHFKKFFIDMQDAGCSSARINRMQSSLRNMIEFAINDEEYEDDYQINVMSKIKGMQKQSVREIIFLSNEEIIALEEELIKRKEYQIALLIDLAYVSVGRRNELFQVEKKGFLDKKVTNTVTGKRGKKFRLKYSNRTKDIAKLYLDERGEDDCPALFTVNDNGKVKQAEYSTLYYWVIKCRKVLCDVTGEYKLFGSHSFRHSGLENYKNGSHYMLKEMGAEKLPLNLLKVLANHSDIGTTQSYVIDDDEEELNKLFADD